MSTWPRLRADGSALFLDFDGTLVDIAPTPELVVVPDSLRDALIRVRARLGEGLAIVTGRPLDQIDHFLPGVPFAVAAEHGAILRRRPDATPEVVPLPEVPDAWFGHADTLARGHEGARLERKRTGFVLHYRGAPDAGPALRGFLDGLIEGREDEFHVLSAKMAWELRSHGADKGTAVEALMRGAPFEGRCPVFVGDDVTDQFGMDACIRRGGAGLMVPEAFGEPEDVRAWLGALAEGDGRAWES